MLPVILGASAVTAAFVVLWWSVSSQRGGARTAAHNLNAGLMPSTDLRQAVLAHSASERAVQPFVSALASRARVLTPAGRLAAIERRIVLGGSPAGWSLERVLATKVGLGGFGLVVGGLRFLSQSGAPSLALWILMTALGFWLPDLLLTNKAQKRQLAVRRALPDTLDQLTITVEAGLAFDAALARSAQTNKGPLAEELSRTQQDVRAGLTRREAMRSLADRVDVAELRSFVTAVLQAEQYGVPIAQVLRVQAGELRTKRRLRAEEQALKLPVKLLFPTILFIFPTLFIVLLGPAGIQLARDVF